MKQKVIIYLMIASTALVLATRIYGETVTPDEAKTAAENWLTVIIQSRGTWGNSEQAAVERVEPYVVDGLTAGYIAHIKPQGFVALSAYHELPPVKVWSSEDALDLNCDEPGTEIVLGALSYSADFIRATADSLALDPTGEKIIASEYVDTWNSLLTQPMDLVHLPATKASRGEYQAGQILLEDVWNQCPPYNDQAPDMNCDWEPYFDTIVWPDHEFYNENAWAGCVAVSGSQAMHYWGWPPRGAEGHYPEGWDWANMQNGYNWRYIFGTGLGYDFYNIDSVPITRPMVDAVAKLMRDVGREINMEYDCDGSSAYVYLGPLPGSLQNALRYTFRFSESILFAPRIAFFDWEWWNHVTDQISANRVLPYAFDGHAFSVDGWDDVGGEFIHVNYGHGPGANCDGHPRNYWYSLTGDICGHEPYEQAMLINVKPQYSLGTSLDGTYEQYGSFQWRYFDQDASGMSAFFEPGQFLQFHLGGVVKGTGGNGNYVKFQGLGTTVSKTYLYTRGDKTKGIKLQQGGTVRLSNNGSIGFF